MTAKRLTSIPVTKPSKMDKGCSLLEIRKKVDQKIIIEGLFIKIKVA